MITKEIIEKLDLKLTDIYVGKSFVTGCKIFEVPNIYETYLLECDSEGERLDKDVFKIFVRAGSGNHKINYVDYISARYILSIDKETLLNNINEEVKKQNDNERNY